MSLRTCLCGCGKVLKSSSSDFLVGHYIRTKKTLKKMSRSKIGHSVSAESRLRMSESKSGSNHPLYGKQRSSETRSKISLALLGRKHTLETRNRMSSSRLGENNHMFGKAGKEAPMYGRKGSLSPRYGTVQSTSTKNKISAAIKGENHPLYGKHHTTETKNRISKSNTGKYRTEKLKRKLSRIFTKRWKDPNFQKKVQNSCNLKPNKSEQKLGALLKELTFGDYKYVGDFQFFLGGRNPDFMNVNGQKKLIELYGDYWHNKQKFPKKHSPLERIKHFSKYGFDTLVIWESELKNNLEGVVDRILLFNYADIRGRELL